MITGVACLSLNSWLLLRPNTSNDGILYRVCHCFLLTGISADHNTDGQQLYRRFTTTFAPVIQERMWYSLHFILVIPRYWKKLLFIYSQCQSVIRLVRWIIWIIFAVNWTKLTACLTDVCSMPSVLHECYVYSRMWIIEYVSCM